MKSKVTETSSLYNDLDKMSVTDLLTNMNREDQKVAEAVQRVIPQIESLVADIWPKMKEGGRIFYIGAGTSGRLGVVDASECPPTFGVPHGMVVGIIAGGDSAIRKAVEFAEDDTQQAIKDLEQHDLNKYDTVIGIAASGSTPYVIGGLQACAARGISTGSISCNKDAEVSAYADHAIEVVVGPEFVTGSTRMKSGTAQKLVLNMISTAVMIKLGRVVGNRMVDMQLSNTKLVDRGTRMVMESLDVTYQVANELLMKHGSVRKAIEEGG